MKRHLSIWAIGLVMVSLGMILGLLFQPVIRAAAISTDSAGKASAPETPEPPLADGAPIQDLGTLHTAQAAALAAVGPVYYRTYGGFEFRPVGSDLTYSPMGAGMYVLSLGVGGNSFKCALGLPNGAQVTRVTMYVIDNDATYNISLQVMANDPSLGTAQNQLAFLSTTNTVTSPTVQSVTVSGSPLFTVDNSQFDYSLRYQPTAVGSTLILIGVRLEFTVPTVFLPDVMK